MFCAFVVVLDTTKVQIFKQITTSTIFLCNKTSCFRYHKGTDFQANHNVVYDLKFPQLVVLDTTKVQIFKQITTLNSGKFIWYELFQIPQRYRFSSKSQQGVPYGAKSRVVLDTTKVQIFKQITTNPQVLTKLVGVVLDTTKVQIFKQITTLSWVTICYIGCFRYHKGTDFQANHNSLLRLMLRLLVVLDTTKVQIFKQITTNCQGSFCKKRLFQIPQRYRFSSKSQPSLYKTLRSVSCFRYHKGTDFQANHNFCVDTFNDLFVVLDTTKVQIFKQITTFDVAITAGIQLFQIPQRYRFSSKSQLAVSLRTYRNCCFRYHKGTDFQANHNGQFAGQNFKLVVLDTTKVQIFKQITTVVFQGSRVFLLFQIPQRYRFSSKSQR